MQEVTSSTLVSSTQYNQRCMLITLPDASEYPSYNVSYISEVADTDLITALKDTESKLTVLVLNIPKEKEDYRYAPDKWSIKEVLLHITDAERVFAYRALRFARNDNTELSGFDENLWVPESNAAARTLEDILKEHHHVRQSTLSLFENMTEEISLRKGRANGKEISVRALGYVICGHALHHLQILKDRYLM